MLIRSGVLSIALSLLLFPAPAECGSIISAIGSMGFQEALSAFEGPPTGLDVEDQEAEYCIMIYASLEGGEPLETFFMQEIVDMLEVRPVPGAHLIVQVDFRKSHGIPSKRYYMYNGLLNIRDSFSNVNMGDKGVFRDFLDWGLSYQAKHRALLVFGHGSGFLSKYGPDALTTGAGPQRSTAIDYGDRDCLTLKEISTVMDEVLPNDKFELLAFRSCLMSEIETAYQLCDHFNYFIATETTQKAGFNYSGQSEDFFDPLFLQVLAEHEGKVSPLQFAGFVYQSIRDTNLSAIDGLSGFGIEIPFEICCVDLRRIGAAIPLLKELSAHLTEGIISDKIGMQVSELIVKARKESPCFYELCSDQYAYTDVCHFIKGLCGNAQALLTDCDNCKELVDYIEHLTGICHEVRSAISRACIAVLNQIPENSGANSVSLLLPDPESRDMAEYYLNSISGKYAELDFPSETGWDEFLNTMYKTARFKQ